MASYIIRKIDADLWQRARAKAKFDGRSLQAVIERLIAVWLTGERLEQAVAMEWGFRAAEKGWNLDESIEEFRKLTNGQ